MTTAEGLAAIHLPGLKEVVEYFMRETINNLYFLLVLPEHFVRMKLPFLSFLIIFQKYDFLILFKIEFARIIFDRNLKLH